MLITISDEHMNGSVTNQLQIDVAKDFITAAELIELRVREEVMQYNKKASEYFNGLVTPKDTEILLNDRKKTPRKDIDAEKQVYVALHAFQQNGFFILVNDKQIDSLEESLQLTAGVKITFIKLTPLVGG